MFLNTDRQPKGGLLFNQYGGAGLLSRSILNRRAITKAIKGRIKRTQPTQAIKRTQPTQPIKRVPRKRVSGKRTTRKRNVRKRTTRKPRKQAPPKQGLVKSLFETGVNTLKREGESLKRNIVRGVKKRLAPGVMARLGEAAGESLTHKIVRGVKKRLAPGDTNEIPHVASIVKQAVVAPSKNRPKLKGRRGRRAQGVLHHIQRMRTKRGGGYFF